MPWCVQDNTHGEYLPHKKQEGASGSSIAGQRLAGVCPVMVTSCCRSASIDGGLNNKGTCADAPGGVAQAQAQQRTHRKPAQNKQQHRGQPQIHRRRVSRIVQPAQSPMGPVAFSSRVFLTVINLMH